MTKRAGVSPTALYLHFADRDAIVDAAVDAGFAAFNGGVVGPPPRRATARPAAGDGRRLPRLRPRQPHLYSVIFSPARALKGGDVDRRAAFDGLLGGGVQPASPGAALTGIHAVAGHARSSPRAPRGACRPSLRSAATGSRVPSREKTIAPSST